MAQVLWKLVKLWGWLAWVIFATMAVFTLIFIWMLVFWVPLYLIFGWK